MDTLGNTAAIYVQRSNDLGSSWSHLSDYCLVMTDLPWAFRAWWQETKSGWEAEQKRLTSTDETRWFLAPEVICTYCEVKGQVEEYKLPAKQQVELAKARRKANYPNIRCGNCSSVWRDESRN